MCQTPPGIGLIFLPLSLQQSVPMSSEALMTSEEVMNEMIQSNQLIPKEVLQDIIQENKNLPSAVIAEIPMVKAAIEYNFKHEVVRPPPNRFVTGSKVLIFMINFFPFPSQFVR